MARLSPHTNDTSYPLYSKGRILSCQKGNQLYELIVDHQLSDANFPDCRCQLITAAVSRTVCPPADLSRARQATWAYDRVPQHIPAGARYSCHAQRSLGWTFAVDLVDDRTSVVWGSYLWRSGQCQLPHVDSLARGRQPLQQLAQSDNDKNWCWLTGSDCTLHEDTSGSYHFCATPPPQYCM